MSDWLQSATRLFRGKPETREQSFEIVCTCGRLHSGIRVAIPQSLECPECQRRLFVLPASPYPPPSQSKSKGLYGLLTKKDKPPAPTPPSDDTEVTLELDTDPEPEPKTGRSASARTSDRSDKGTQSTRSRDSNQSRDSKPGRRTEGERGNQPQSFRDSRNREAATTDATPAGDKTGEGKLHGGGSQSRPARDGKSKPVPAESDNDARSGANPNTGSAGTAVPATRGTTPTNSNAPGTIASGAKFVPHQKVQHRKTRIAIRFVVVLVVVAIGFGIWALNVGRKRSEAEQSLGEDTRLALAALESGQLDEAADHFEKAIAAIDLLERDEPRALSIRQVGRETIARARLCREPIEALLTEAAGARFGEGSAWRTRFQTNIRNRWMIIDSNVSSISQRGAAPAPYIECPLSAGNEPVRFAGNIVDLSRLPLSNSEPRRVIFAVRIQDIHPEANNQPGVVVELDPNASFLWTNSETLEACGFPMDDEVQAILKSQSRVVGVSP